MAMSLIQACRSLALSTWLLSFCFVHLLCLDFTVAEKEEWYTAFVNITYLDPVTSEIKTEKTECGRYGEHSPKKEARGQVLMPFLLQERQACDPNAKYPLPYQNNAWVALIAAGNCTFRDKIRNVAALNASAVIIYNVGSTNVNDTITMPHQGTRNLQKYVSRTSVVFVSISFIVLMIISLAWLIFYYIQRFRYANARDRNQRRLGDAAKKAISKLQVRTIRKGDKETESDFDNCAVCIEGYKANDVFQNLSVSLSFPTLVLERFYFWKPNFDCGDDIPPDYEMSVGGPPTNPITGASDITVNGEESSVPPLSSDSDTSLILAVEVGLSDMELSLGHDRDEAKS
ncbi:unnamed protein product [Coregonus sp. 'balchen']|nr:unnamed protein product [Coregonus sp. 'balchen']